MSEKENISPDQKLAHTPGPWWVHREYSTLYIEGKARDTRVVQEVAAIGPKEGGSEQQAADARLIAAAPDLLEALHEGRRAIGDHFVPNHCYATGPMTGDPIRDLVHCPACIFIKMYDAAIAKVTGAK